MTQLALIVMHCEVAAVATVLLRRNVVDVSNTHRSRSLPLVRPAVLTLLRFDWLDRQTVVEDDFDLIVSSQTLRVGPNLRKDHE